MYEHPPTHIRTRASARTHAHTGGQADRQADTQTFTRGHSTSMSRPSRCRFRILERSGGVPCGPSCMSAFASSSHRYRLGGRPEAPSRCWREGPSPIAQEGPFTYPGRQPPESNVVLSASHLWPGGTRTPHPEVQKHELLGPHYVFALFLFCNSLAGLVEDIPARGFCTPVPGFSRWPGKTTKKCLRYVRKRIRRKPKRKLSPKKSYKFFPTRHRAGDEIKAHGRRPRPKRVSSTPLPDCTEDALPSCWGTSSASSGAKGGNDGMVPGNTRSCSTGRHKHQSW